MLSHKGGVVYIFLKSVKWHLMEKIRQMWRFCSELTVSFFPAISVQLVSTKTVLEKVKSRFPRDLNPNILPAGVSLGRRGPHSKPPECVCMSDPNARSTKKMKRNYNFNTIDWIHFADDHYLWNAGWWAENVRTKQLFHYLCTSSQNDEFLKTRRVIGDFICTFLVALNVQSLTTWHNKLGEAVGSVMSRHGSVVG